MVRSPDARGARRPPRRRPGRGSAAGGQGTGAAQGGALEEGGGPARRRAVRPPPRPRRPDAGPLLRLLAESAAGLRQRAAAPPPWLRRLARAFSRPRLPLPATVEEGGDLGALELLRPLIADAHARALTGLRRLAGGSPGLLAPEELAAALLPTLARRLRWASERAFALELQASRLEGTLAGETPEERFASFVARLRRPADALELLRRYPVLARDACRHAEQWVETSLEMMRRFAADRDEILSTLLTAGASPGPVTTAQAGLSDRHAGGRSVAILAFASGERVVYKPKPMAADLELQSLTAWLNARGAEPPLRCLEVVERGDYGWMEAVSPRPCVTPEEVERFHERQGGWLALLYALEATDFHYENLVAEGEHPVPIDFETLFQPAFPEPALSGPGYSPTTYTVLHSGLLPRRFWATVADGGMDLSGMGAAAGQSYEMKGITGERTDEMRWAPREMRTAAGRTSPPCAASRCRSGSTATPSCAASARCTGYWCAIARSCSTPRVLSAASRACRYGSSSGGPRSTPTFCTSAIIPTICRTRSTATACTTVSGWKRRSIRLSGERCAPSRRLWQGATSPAWRPGPPRRPCSPGEGP